MEQGSEPLSVEVGANGRIKVGGELDVHTATALSDAVAAVFDQGSTTIVIDAGDLRFCDSSGIQVLVQARERAIEAGGAVTITGVHGAVEKVLTVTGLLELFS
jgi:anti-sigma B factor antagonist